MFWIKVTLLTLSTLTIMSGSTVAPALPQMSLIFSSLPHAGILTKLVLTIPSIFIALFSPLAGIVVDRFGRRKLLLFCLVVYGIAGPSGAFINNLYGILIGRAVLGIAIAGIMTTIITLIGDYFKGEELNEFMGWRSAGNAFGGVIFIMAGGFLADVNWHFPFFVYFAALLMFFPTLFFIREPTAKERNYLDEKNSGKLSKAMIAVIYLISFLGLVFFFIMPVETPFLLEHEMGLSASKTGIAIAVSLLAAAFMSLGYKYISARLNYKNIYAITFGLMGAGYFVISVSENYITAVAGLIIMGLGFGIFVPNTTVWLINVTPGHLRGRLIGGMTTTIFLGQFFSPVIFHPLGSATSLFHVFATASAALLLLALVFFFAGWKRSRA